MTPKQLQALIDGANKTQIGLAQELGIGGRTMRHYLSGTMPITPAVEFAARCRCTHSPLGGERPMSEEESRTYLLVLALWPQPPPRVVEVAARCISQHRMAAPAQPGIKST